MKNNFTKKLVSFLAALLFLISVLSWGFYFGLNDASNNLRTIKLNTITEDYDVSKLGESYFKTTTVNITSYVSMWKYVARCIGISSTVGVVILLAFQGLSRKKEKE